LREGPAWVMAGVDNVINVGLVVWDQHMGHKIYKRWIVDKELA
jgi:hypothetical protein